MVWPFTTIRRLEQSCTAFENEVTYLELRLAKQSDKISKLIGELEAAKSEDKSVLSLRRQISVLKQQLAEAQRQSDAFEAVSREACAELEAKPKRKKVA